MSKRELPVEELAQLEYMTRTEAAQYLRCSVRNLERLQLSGIIPRHRISPQRIVFKRSDLDRYIEKCREGTVQESVDGILN